jgi:hypothetical protein
MIKKIFVLSIFLFSSLFLSSCGQTISNQEKINNNIVSKTGTLTMKSGDEYLLSTSDGIVNITSNKVNLDNYLKKKITVMGQFSGSTLYVDEIN